MSDAPHPQSVLEPAGPAAAEIAGLHWMLVGISTAVFLLVVALLTIGLAKRRGEATEAFVVFWGVLFTTAVVAVLLFVAISATVRLRGPLQGEEEALEVRVTGHQWWWKVEYPQLGITDANEIHLPVGRPVRLELLAQDVIHSLWIPNLHGKMDLIPGITNVLWLEATRPGVYRGQCAEFCGLQHALMALEVVAWEVEDFTSWTAARRAPRAPPVDSQAARGEQVFFRAACHHCHAVRGTAADATLGPDLSHLGSRRTLGAGIVPNTPERLSRWIADPNEIKPGALMPPSELSPEDLEDLRRYLEELR